MSLKHRRKLLRVLFWVVSILMTAFVVGGIYLPRQLKVTRSISIRASPVTVYDKLESFKQWELWAPWFRRDRFIDKKFEGPGSGPGSVMTWKSKSEGEGRIKMVSGMTPQSLNMAVEFGETGEADTWFELKGAESATTEVTWGFRTDFGHNMARRYFGLLFAAQVRRDLDEGLANLKAVIEQAAPGGGAVPALNPQGRDGAAPDKPPAPLTENP